MPELREGSPSSSPERKLSLGNARLNTGRYLADIRNGAVPSVSDSEFLLSFGLLVRRKSKLGRLGQEVDTIAGSLISQAREARDGDPSVSGNALIPNFLSGALTGALEKQLRELRQAGGIQGGKKGLERARETFENYSAAASALNMGGEDNPNIQSLLDQCREGLYKPDDPNRRKHLRLALKAGGAFALAGAGIGTFQLGAASQRIDNAGSTPVKEPAPRRPSPPVPSPAERSSPSPSPYPSPSAQAVARAEASPPPKPSPDASPSPTAEKKREPSPTPVEDAAEKTIGNKDFIDFFLGNFIRDFQGKGITLWNELPEYRDRVAEKFASSENITFAYLGIDDTRQRPKEFNGAGWGRADVIMVISFNPRTLRTTMISIPRDALSPEVLQTGVLGDKINAATMTDYLKAQSPNRNQELTDSKPLMQKILETATGLRIDGIIQTNIDFMQGYVDYVDHKGNWTPGKDGIFNRLFRYLRIVPKKDLLDTEYPGPGYSKIRVEFKKGQEYFMDGWQITQYARMRHGDSDYGRSERQREIATAAIIELLPRLIDDLGNRHTNTLDEIITVLQEQKEVANMFEHESDLVYMISEIRDSAQDILSKPNADAILARLFANSAKIIETMVKERNMPFKSFGVTTENMLTGYKGSTNIMTGGESHLKPNQFGNFTQYWSALRAWVGQNVPA